MEFGGEEEIELSLGLAIGGGCKKRLRLEDRVCEVPENGEAGGKEGEEQEQVDLVKRREMQAQRRQEARRKREEKKHMKRGGLKVVRNSSMNQKVDDGVIVEESDGAERALKREKIESGLQPQATKSDAVEGADQSCSNASEFITSEQAAPASAFAFPIYAYPPFQYVPFANGFAFPCVAPSVYRAEESDGTNKIAPPQTVSFRPFLGGKKSNDVNLRGAAATVNGRNCEGNVKDLSNGSLCCCSSAISENRSISSQDGSSSDSGSHLSCPKSGKTELHSSSGSDLPRTSKRKALSNPSTSTDAEKANNDPPATAFQPTPSKVSKQDTSVVEQKPAKIPILRSTSLPQPKTPITKDNKVDSNNPGKPPRPQPVDNQKTNSPLSQMPCVSTTGNGPDGKTITGFLYRYNTTAEVSIVCVCHGESFTPAEFVKHAGGIDVSHPLRHITVVPSAF